MLSEKIGYQHITTGGLIRDKMENDLRFKNKFASQMAKGKLLSDKIILDLLKEKLKTIPTGKHIILDGVPRNIKQINPLSKLLDELGYSKVSALQLGVDDSIIVDRISGRTVCSNCQEGYHVKNKPSSKGHLCEKCGGALITRPDDNPVSVMERLKVYHQLTEPVIEHYRKQGNFIEVNDDGSKSIQRIHQDTMNTLRKQRFL